MLPLLLLPLLPLVSCLPCPDPRPPLLIVHPHQHPLSPPPCASLLSRSEAHDLYLLPRDSRECETREYMSAPVAWNGFGDSPVIIDRETPEGAEKRMFWVRESSAAPEGGPESVREFVERVRERWERERQAQKEEEEEGGEQQVLGPDGLWRKRREPPITLLYAQTTRTALIMVHPSVVPTLDSHLPPHLSLVSISPTPLPTAASDGPDPTEILGLLDKLEFNPLIDLITSTISVESLEKDVRYLTGEDTSSPITSRHSFTRGALHAAHYIADQLTATGASCTLEPFLPHFAPNVICTYAGTSDRASERVILSAHYDSRGSFGFTRAPGADDDASGVAHLLAVGRAIGEFGLNFDRTFYLIAFAGEEQGLLGSSAYAASLRAENASVALQVQADMLAYRKEGEPMQLGQPDKIGLPEAAWLVGNVSHLYAPELVVGFTPACCSDHQSFVEHAFPATWVFERAGSIADPKYHNSQDLSSRRGFDLNQLRSITKVTFATILEVAGFSL